MEAYIQRGHNLQKMRVYTKGLSFAASRKFAKKIPLSDVKNDAMGMPSYQKMKMCLLFVRINKLNTLREFNNQKICVVGHCSGTA